MQSSEDWYEILWHLHSVYTVCKMFNARLRWPRAYTNGPSHEILVRIASASSDGSDEPMPKPKRMRSLVRDFASCINKVLK